MNEVTVREVTITIKGDDSVGIRDEVISIKGLSFDVNLGDAEDKDYLNEIRNKLEDVFSLMHGEPTIVEFDFEIAKRETEFGF